VEMKYKINMDLQHFDSAVLELSKGNAEQIERSLSLIKKHDLYHLGLKIYVNNPQITNLIKDSLGEYLMSKKDYKLAGLTYEGSGNIKKAIESYRYSHDWKKAIILIKTHI